MSFPVYDRIYVTERLVNQAPRTPEVHSALDAVTLAAIEFGALLCTEVPQGPDLRLALGHVEDALYRAKKGIALNQEAVGGIDLR